MDYRITVMWGGLVAEYRDHDPGGRTVYELLAIDDPGWPEEAAVLVELPTRECRRLRRDGSVVGRPDEWYGWLMDMAYEAGWG